MPNRFHTTPWSLILTAKRDSAPGSADALGELCQLYWFPLYAFIRRRGHSREEAEDLTQGFFTLLIERQFLEYVDKTKGRFRSYLLTSLDHFLTDDWHRKRAVKRGGGAAQLSLDVERAEGLYLEAAANQLSAEDHFDRDWAQTVLAAALHDVRDEYARRGQGALFARLKPYLTGEGPAAAYREAAAELGMNEPAVKVAVHRLRKRLGQAIRQRIAETLDDPEQIEVETKYLLRIV